MPIRTNNDVQGWHNKLNKKVNHRSPFYFLVTALHDEAFQIPINIELLEMKCLKRVKKTMFDFIKNCLGIGSITKKEENLLKNF